MARSAHIYFTVFLFLFFLLLGIMVTLTLMAYLTIVPPRATV